MTGIQNLEHWKEPLPGIKLHSSYSDSLEAAHRVLRPGGSIYFDAPIHLHGHEMFRSGDIARICYTVDAALWHEA